MTRPGATIIVLLTAVTFSVGGGVGGARAQITIPTLFPPPTTTTTTAPGTPPPPSTTPPTTANLLGSLLKLPTTTVPTTAPAPPPPTAAAKSTTIPGNAGGEGSSPSAEAGPFPADLAAKMNSVRRSGPRTSYQLVDALRSLTDLGVPIDEAMRLGMGRFPVAGPTNFTDDWWFPRFGPGWRLHEGTDLFAERGTPLRSPTVGTVRFGEGGLGGISVYVTQSDGTYFYFAHLDRRPPGLKNGQLVATGDIIGFVGTTGNAAGGSPHLHFEVHPATKLVTIGKGRKAVTKAVSAPVRPGTVLPAIDPKPLLDLYLSEALARLPALVASFKLNQPPAAPPVPDGPSVPGAVVLASQHLSSGGLIAADAPLARTPLLGLAFLLIVMVVVLTPVLAPHRRLAPTVSGGPGRRAAAKRGRTASSPRRARRAKGKATAPVQSPPPTTVGLGTKDGTTSTNGNGTARLKRLRGPRRSLEDAAPGTTRL